MANYMDLVLAKNDNGDVCTFLVPTSKVKEGDVLLFDGVMFEIIDSDWIDAGSRIYKMLESAGTFLIPDKALATRWEREEDKEEVDAQDT